MSSDCLTDLVMFIHKSIVVFLLSAFLVFFYLLNRKIDRIKTSHVRAFSKTLDIDKRVDNTFVGLQARIDAKRISLLRFSNGQEFLPNNPVWRITGTNIIKGDGISEDGIDNLPVARVLPLVEPVIMSVSDSEWCDIPATCSECSSFQYCKNTNKRIVGLDVSRMPASYTKIFLENRGTGYAYLASLTDEKNRVFAVVLVEYSSRPDEDKRPFIETNICTVATKIRFLFK